MGNLEHLTLEELLARCKERSLIDDYERGEEIVTIIRGIASFRLSPQQARAMLRKGD